MTANHGILTSVQLAIFSGGVYLTARRFCLEALAQAHVRKESDGTPFPDLPRASNDLSLEHVIRNDAVRTAILPVCTRIVFLALTTAGGPIFLAASGIFAYGILRLLLALVCTHGLVQHLPRQSQPSASRHAQSSKAARHRPCPPVNRLQRSASRLRPLLCAAQNPV